MEPIFIFIGIAVLLIAYFHREIRNQIEHNLKINQLQNDKHVEVNKTKLEYIEKNQQKLVSTLTELKQENRELEKELRNVKGDVVDHKVENRVNQETTRAKLDFVGENMDRLFLKHRKTNSKFNQQQIEFQTAEKQNTERFFKQDAQLQVTKETTKTAIEYLGKNVSVLQGELQYTNQKVDQQKNDLNTAQMQNEHRFHQQETQLQVHQAESRTAIKYIDKGIEQLSGDLKSTNQSVERQQIEFHKTQLQNEHHFHQQETLLQVQQAETKTAIKYIDHDISKLQIDAQSINQRVDKQQNEFNNARVQIADQFGRQGKEIEKTKQASRSAIERLDSKLAILHKANQEQKSGTNQLLNLVGAISPLVNVGVQAFKAISDSNKNDNNSSSFDKPISFDSSEPMPTFEFQTPEEVIDMK